MTLIDKFERGDSICMDEIPALLDSYKAALKPRDEEIAARGRQLNLIIDMLEGRKPLHIAFAEYPVAHNLRRLLEEKDEAYHTLLDQAIRFAEMAQSDIITEGSMHQALAFLARPEVQARRKG